MERKTQRNDMKDNSSCKTRNQECTHVDSKHLFLSTFFFHWNIIIVNNTYNMQYIFGTPQPNYAPDFPNVLIKIQPTV